MELASQFLENFTYDRATLSSLSSHVDTGAPLPKDVFDALIRARNFRAGSALLRQLHFSTLDMALHDGKLGGLPTDAAATQATSPQQVAQLISSVGDLERTLSPRTSVMPFDPASRFLNSFSHIFAGGYSAGYYSYKWAETMSADAFGAFEEALADQPTPAEAAKRWAALGRKYRDTVLALGGSVPAAEVFRMFRGRDPSTAPLLRQAGLKQ